MKKILTNVRIAQYFKAYPRLKTMWFTSDGSGHISESDALAFAESKGYDTPRKVKREEVDAKAESLCGKLVKLEPTTTEPSEDDKAKLLAFELSEDCDWNELQKLGKAFKIEASTKAEHIEALKPIKDKLED